MDVTSPIGQVDNDAATSTTGVDNDGATSTTGSSPAASSWVKLSEGHQFSRLLYPNPVCFLACPTNVMVVSWLTATNNNGHFMFSLCKRRHTASLLQPNSKFTLSVPVRGMEELVLDVGGTSGRNGSKFGAATTTVAPVAPDDDHRLEPVVEAAATSPDQRPESKRQKKKRRRHQGWKVPHLEAVPLESSPQQQPVDRGEERLFAIRGTVAHMVCHVQQIVSDTIDSDHHLVLATINSAEVHPNYWDQSKNQFRPLQEETPPFLTFFGSQRFGYVFS